MSKVRFEYQLVSRGTRLGGAFLDGIISALIIIPIFFAIGAFGNEMIEEPNLGMQIFQFLIGWIVFFALNGHLLVKRRQTLGKMIVNSKVVNKRGRTPSVTDIIGKRYIVPSIISSIPLVGQVFGLVNALFIFREDKRCVHDHIAGTYVVEA